MLSVILDLYTGNNLFLSREPGHQEPADQQLVCRPFFAQQHFRAIPLGPRAFLKRRFPGTGAPQYAPVLRAASEARQQRSECCLCPGVSSWATSDSLETIGGACMN